MACSIKQIKSDSMDKVRAIVKGKANTVSFTKNGDALITPSSSSKKVKDIVSARKMAEQKIRMINKWSKDKFGTDAYQGQWTAIYENPSAVRLELKFPKKLEEHYQIKINSKEAAQIQSEDAERAGIDYTDDYLFDELPASQDGYNYGLYLKKKIDMRNYFSNRISVLEQMSVKNKDTFKQISDFKEIVKTFNKDIKALETEQGILENFFNYFNNDLNTIRNILMGNQTMDNLVSARNVVDELKFIINYEPTNNKKQIYFSDEKFSEITDSSQRKLFEDFSARLNQLDLELTNAEKDFLHNGLESQNLTDDAEQQAKQISWFARFLLPVDGSSDSSPIMKYVRKTYDDAIGKSETYNLRESLESIKEKVTKKLKREGKTFKIFQRVTTNGDFILAGKYNDSWNKFSVDVQRQFSKIQELTYKKNKDIEDYEKIREKRESLFDKLNGNVEFIDVRRIPEIKNHPDMHPSFQRNFLDDAEAERYKEELITMIMGSGNNRKVAERIYNRIIDEQLEKIFAFEVDMTNQMNRILKEEGVDTFDDLSDRGKSHYLEINYTNSPFAFSESYTTTGTSTIKKPYFVEGNQGIGNDTATLEYQSYIPKNRDFIDIDFQNKIESDEDYYSAWEMLDTATRYINRNRSYKSNEEKRDDALIYEQDLYKQNVNSILTLAKHYSKLTIDRIKQVVSTSKYKDPNNPKMRNSVASSINEAINKAILPKKLVMENAGYKMDEIQTPSALDTKTRDYLIDINDGPLPNQFVIGELITEIATKEVTQSQKDNLFEVLHSQLEVVEKFKAKKEIENKLLFLKNLIESKTGTSDPKEIQNNIAVVKEFINANLYDVNNRANWGFRKGAVLRQSESAGTLLFNYSEEETINEINNAVSMIKELMKDMTDQNEIEKAQKDIDALIAFKNSKGRIISPGSITETIAIKIPVLAGLGLNLTSQIGNLFIGNLSGRQNDGLEWTNGNFIVADSYTRKWKIARRKLRPQERKNQRLTNTLIDGLGIFQNSANEVHKVIESDIKNKALKYATNPLHIVSDMEKTIQRPQILAKLGDVKITDKNGNEVPVFDVNNLSEPHPAFTMSNGVLSLKPEFDTPENRATWINRNSEEYARLFGESGEIPQMIARINGDYRNSSKTGIKQTTLGAAFMMFKTWMPAFIQRRFGRKHGVISNLYESGRGAETALLTGITASMYMAIGPMIYFSPLFTIVGMATYMGYKTFQKSKADDISYFNALWKEIKATKLKMSFVKTPFQLAAGVATKFVQQGTNTIFGKQLISNDAIAKIAGVQQKEGESDSDFELNKARLNFLLTEASTTLMLLILKSLVNALLFPDEEEEKKYKELDGFYNKVTGETDTALYYLFENMLTRFADDVNLLNDGASIGNSMKIGIIEKTTGLFTAAYQQMENGNYQRGPHTGKNRLLVKGTDFAIPRGMLDYSLGFGKTIREDYRKKDKINKFFQSDLDTYEAKRQQLRTERKLELQKEYKKRYWNKDAEYIEKKVQKKLKKEFPTIKKYFNEDGSVKSYKKYKLKRYE